MMGHSFRVRVGSIVVIAGLALAACTPAPPSTSPPSGGAAPAATTPERAAEQKLRMSSQSINPSIAPEAYGILVWFNSMVFDSLTRLDDKLQPVPGVAERWEALPNGEGWRFFIRKDMVWPNGDKLTAADVAWTMNTMIASRWLGVSNFPAVTGARQIDDWTVDFLTRQPDISTLVNGAYFFVVPQKIYEQLGKDAFGLKPQGSGPYEVVDFKPSDTVVWRLRSGYNHPYRTANLTEITLRAIPEPATALAGLRTGELDFVIGVTNIEQAEAAERAGLKIHRRVTSNYVLLVDRDNSRNSPLSNKLVRQALNYAIDRELIAKNIFKGTAIPMGQLGLPGAPMHVEELKPYPFDQRRAKELLAQAGYPNGFTLPLGYDFSPAFHSEALTLAVQDFFKQVGVETKINSWDANVWQDKLFGRNNQTRGDIYAVTYGDANGLMTFGRSLLTCNNAQAVLVCVPEFDRFMNLAYGEPDAAKRAQYLQQANRAFVDELPAVFVTASGPTYVMRPVVQGFAPVNVTFFTFDGVFLTK
jgi:ABC-type transport system substrate-binding protein